MTEEKICCPEFHPEKWDQKTFNWNSKPFIRETIPTFFHIPYPPMIDQKITQMCQSAEAAQKIEADKENVLILFHDPSAFKSEIYFSVTGSVPEADNANLSGTFVAKVFAGGYNAVPKFIKQLDAYLATQNQKARDYYIHYAYCPKCAQKYGGNNYMIIFAQV